MLASILKPLAVADDIRTEEVAAIFRTVTFAVLAAYAAASGTIATLVVLGFAEPPWTKLVASLLCSVIV